MNIHRIILCVCLIVGVAVAFAGTTNNTTSTDMTPPTRNNMIKCPSITFGNLTLTNTSQPVPNMGGVSCVGGVFAGTIVTAGGVIGGAFDKDCPSDHPYLGGFIEGWGVVMAAAGDATMTMTCCTMPQPSMRFVSGTGNWVAGTLCP